MKKQMIPHKDRLSRPVTIRMPVDVVEDLKRVAPVKGMSGYQALIKYYVGQGLREDLETLWADQREERLESALKKLGLGQDRIERFWELLREDSQPLEAESLEQEEQRRAAHAAD